MKSNKMLFLGACLCVLLYTSLASAAPLIYIANSYDEKSFTWTKQINDGFLEGLKKAGLVQGKDFEVHVDNMDALVKATEDQMKAEGERLVADIMGKKPAVVLVTDDDALKFVGLKLENTPIVFNGVNDVKSYLSSGKVDSVEKPGHNVTGVYQTTYFSQSLKMLQQINPDIKTFAAITDDSTTGNMLLKGLKEVEGSLPLELKEVLKSNSLNEWKSKVQAWQGETDVIFVLSPNAVQDESGTHIPYNEVMAQALGSSKLLDTAPWEFIVAAGPLLAAADDGAEQGIHSAMMVAEILKGKKAGDISIITPPNGVPVLNAKRVESLGIEIPSEMIEQFINYGRVIE